MSGVSFNQAFMLQLVFVIIKAHSARARLANVSVQRKVSLEIIAKDATYLVCIMEIQRIKDRAFVSILLIFMFKCVWLQMYHVLNLFYR